MSAIRIVVADDHDLFRRGLIEVMEEESDIEIVGEARNGREAVQRAADLSPDVVFMDLNMPEQGGIEATAYLNQNLPDVKVLVLTVSEEPADLFRCLSVGALGYVLKTASPQAIIDALHQVHQGWVVVSPAMAPRFLNEMGQVSDAGHAPQAGVSQTGETQLTMREQDILRHVAKGLSNSEIAEALIVSENTVKTHIKNILGKLHMKNRSEAVAYAARIGVIEIGQESPPSGQQ